MRDEVRKVVRESSLYLVGRINCYFATEMRDGWRPFIAKEKYTVCIAEPQDDKYYKEVPLVLHENEVMDDSEREETIGLEISNLKRFLFWTSVHETIKLTDEEIENIRGFLDEHAHIIKQIPVVPVLNAQEIQ